MEISSGLLIALDAGHGGWDNGAHAQGRKEKDDNLRLATAVRQKLEAQGINVLMTRDTDMYVAPQDRVRMANEAGADLFVSLHRNAYPEQTPDSHGVEAFIYLTAPIETSGAAASIVLRNIADTNVQSDRGVTRGNYYVLRKTTMPSILLEMGFVVDETDNRLFDENLNIYAAAIAKGILQYFGEEYIPTANHAVQVNAAAGAFFGLAGEAQRVLGETYEIEVPQTGVFDVGTKRAITEALQFELNDTYGLDIAEDGLFGEETRDAVRDASLGDDGALVHLLQLALALGGYNPGLFDRKFGPRTKSAVIAFQRDNYLEPDGIAGPDTWEALLSL